MCIRDRVCLVRVNGTTSETFTEGHGSQSDNNLAIGSAGDNGEYFDGDIAELIMFADDQSDTKRKRIESYLAIKYGITLDANQDYVDSGGTTIFDSNGTQSGYTNNIAGIGQDDAQSLNQSSSTAQKADAIITVGSASDLDDGEFLLWGNDNGTTSEIESNLSLIHISEPTRPY